MMQTENMKPYLSSMNQRTPLQNRAMHKYFTMLAEELNAAGLDMKTVLKPTVDIPWTPESIKNHLWRPVQDAMFDKESTTELTTKDLTQVYETLTRHLGEKFGTFCRWPSIEPDLLSNQEE